MRARRRKRSPAVGWSVPAFLGSDLLCVLLVAVVFVTAIVLPKVSALETTFAKPCPDNPPIPCGVAFNNQEGPGATYTFQGVQSGIPIEEIVNEDPEAAQELNTLFGSTSTVTFSRLIFDVIFQSGIVKGCRIDEQWLITTAWVPNGAAQCNIGGPCTTDVCFDLEGSTSQASVNMLIDNVFYATGLEEATSHYPFDIMSLNRKKVATQPNDDVEDDNKIYMNQSVEDDDYNVHGDGGQTANGYDDDDDQDLPTRCDDDSYNDCSSGGTDKVLAPCYTGTGERLALYAYGHPYMIGYSDDRTCGNPGHDPGIDSDCTDNCDRSLNPAVAFGLTVYDLYDAYSDGGTLEGCDLVNSGFGGCNTGGRASEWDKRPRGDDDDDEGDFGSSNSQDDDDDDDNDDDTDCRESRADGVAQIFTPDAIMSSLAALKRGEEPLPASLFNHLSTGHGGIRKWSANDADVYIVPTCGFCKGQSDGTSIAHARRFIQYAINPICSKHAILAVGTFADNFNLVWTGIAEVNGVQYNFADTYTNGAMQRARFVSNTDTNSPAYGTTVTITMGDASLFSAPASVILGNNYAVTCFGEDDPPPLSSAQDGIFPFVRDGDTCNGCTSMQQSGTGSDQRLWFTALTSLIGYWDRVCGYGFGQGLHKNVGSGLSDGGTQTTNFFTDLEQVNTGQSTVVPMTLCDDAISSETALMCRPPGIFSGTTSYSTPAGIAAAKNNWYSRVLAGEFDSPVAMNAAWKTSGFGSDTEVYGYKPAVSPNAWYFNGNTEISVPLASMNLAGQYREDISGDPVFEDDQEAVTFRVAFYIPDTLIYLGVPLLHVDTFGVAISGATSLCPVTYATPVPGACQANGPYSTATDAQAYCGFTYVQLEMSAPEDTPADTTFKIRLDFSECNDSGTNALYQFCSTSDTTCAMLLASEISFQIGDDTTTALATGGSVLFYSANMEPSCFSECPIAVEQFIAGEWKKIASATVPDCQQLSVPADRGACQNAIVSSTPSPTVSTTSTPAGSSTPSATFGTSPSVTPTVSTTNTATASPSLTPSTTATLGGPSPTTVGTSSSLFTPVPAVGSTASPSPTPSPSPSDLFGGPDQNSTCTTCDLKCKCGPNGDASSCIRDPCGLATIAVAVFALLCVCLFSCLCCCLCVKKVKNRDSDEMSIGVDGNGEAGALSASQLQ